MNLDTELKAALHRKSPDDDFAARVMDRIAAAESRSVRAIRPLQWRAVAAALTMTVLLGGWAAREAANRRAEERARDEVLTALRITSEKLRFAQQQVQQIGSKHE